MMNDVCTCLCSVEIVQCIYQYFEDYGKILYLHCTGLNKAYAVECHVLHKSSSLNYLFCPSFFYMQIETFRLEYGCEIEYES